MSSDRPPGVGPDKTMHQGCRGYGLAHTFHCIKCNQLRSTSGRRKIKGTSVYQCAGCEQKGKA